MFEHGARRLRAAPVAANHQNRVVAGDRPDDIRQPRAIDGQTQQLRLPRPGLDDHELLRRIDAQQKLPQRPRQGDRSRRWRSGVRLAGAADTRRRTSA